jgi:outer membrane protein assembly factor BamB
VQEGTEKNEINSIIGRLLTLARNPTASRFTENQLMVPFLGSSDSELAMFDYVIKPWSTEYFFCCCDLSGEEQWRLALPIPISGNQAFVSNRYSDDYSTYVKGVRNFLLFVNGKSMVAIDTSPQSEKILWLKTSSSTLLTRQNSSDRRLESSGQRPAVANVPFPQNSVFVSPYVICCWDANCVYGLDPLTGQTLWVRKVPYDNCTILGDEENLFLVFPDARHVMAIDSASGRELASGSIPSGGVYTYGTNIVFIRRHRGTDEFALDICDLRTIHNKRLRTSLISDLPGPIPTEILHARLNDNMALLQILRGDRFLSVANWGTKSLQIHDLLMKKKLLPEENKMLEFVSENNLNLPTMRCDTEFVGDHFLVLFTKDIHIRGTPETVRENDTEFQRRYNRPGVPAIGVGEGMMMLFDSAGNSCWAHPTKIEKTYRLLDIPNRLPVMLFTVLLTDRDSTNKNIHSTKIMGVDKRSGEVRFHKPLSPNPQVALQSFRVSANPVAQEITFMTSNAFPPRIVKVTFTDETEREEK